MLFTKESKKTMSTKINKLLQKFNLIYSVSNYNSLEDTLEKINSEYQDSIKNLSKQNLQKYERDMELFGIRENLFLAEIDPIVGQGIFLKPTARAIKKNQFIGIYTGEYIITKRNTVIDYTYAFELISGIKKKTLSSDLRKEIKLKQKDRVAIDLNVNAKNKGNFTRFINHSCTPNVRCDHRFVHGKPEVIYYALKDIRPGEQLLVDYDEGYWENLGIEPFHITPQTFILKDTRGFFVEKVIY